MNWELLARFLLRLCALAIVAWGNVSEESASVLYQNADFVAMFALTLSEGWFALRKWRDRRGVKP